MQAYWMSNMDGRSGEIHVRVSASRCIRPKSERTNDTHTHGCSLFLCHVMSWLGVTTCLSFQCQHDAWLFWYFVALWRNQNLFLFDKISQTSQTLQCSKQMHIWPNVCGRSTSDVRTRPVTSWAQNRWLLVRSAEVQQFKYFEVN